MLLFPVLRLQWEASQLLFLSSWLNQHPNAYLIWAEGSLSIRKYYVPALVALGPGTRLLGIVPRSLIPGKFSNKPVLREHVKPSQPPPIYHTTAAPYSSSMLLVCPQVQLLWSPVWQPVFFCLELWLTEFCLSSIQVSCCILPSKIIFISYKTEILRLYILCMLIHLSAVLCTSSMFVEVVTSFIHLLMTNCDKYACVQYIVWARSFRWIVGDKTETFWKRKNKKELYIIFMSRI